MEFLEEDLCVANQIHLGLQGEDIQTEKVESFLQWLGVAKIPRIKLVSHVPPKFDKYTFNNREFYPVSHNGNDLPSPIPRAFNSKKDLISYDLRKVIGSLSSIDRLEELLKKAEPEAIVALIHVNRQVFKKVKDDKAKITIRYKKAERELDKKPPYYPRWVLNNEKWLPTENGKKHKPSTCTLESFPHEISKIIGFPKINYEHNIFKELNIKKNEVKEALRVAGVVDSLKNLSWDSFYEILKKLPEEDPTGEIAKQVYECLENKIKKLHNEPSGEEYDLFMKEGKLWGRNKDKEGKFKDCYCDLSKLRYLDNTNIPISISNLVPYVHLNDSLGVENVKKCFGIESFDISKTKIQNKYKKDLDKEICEEFQKEIENLKPFALCLVEDIKSKSEDILRDLKDLNVKLCSAFTGSICIDNEVKEFGLEANEYIKISENTSEINVYIVANDDLPDQPTKDAEISKILEEIFSDILKERINNIRLLIKCNNDQERIEDLNTIIKNGESRLKAAKDKLYIGDVKNPEEVIDPDQIIIDETSPEKGKETEKEKEIKVELNNVPPVIMPDSRKGRVNGGTGRWKPLSFNEIQLNNKVPLEEVLENGKNQKTHGKIDSSNLNKGKQPSPSTDRISEGNKKRIGKWGEEYIFRSLKDDLEKRYPGKLKETVNGFKISIDSKKIEVTWHNKERESKNNYDIEIIEDDNTKYIEVKTTITDTDIMKSFDISKDEWKFAEDNKEKYHIYRVYNAGNENVKYIDIPNPHELKELKVEPRGYIITI